MTVATPADGGPAQPGRAAQPLVQVRGLTKLYGSRAAVQDVDFDVRSGEVLGLLGLNGAGKTTILRILAGDLCASCGEVLIDGQAVGPDARGLRADVGLLPEAPPLYPEMTARSYLRFVAALNGVARSALEASVEAAIEQFDLHAVAEQEAGTLSLGFRKRLGLAQAAVHSPRLLLLDEPISGLDPAQIVEVRRKIRSMAGRHTLILSSHNLPEIHATCDRILLLREGRVVAQGDEATLVERLGQGRRRWAVSLRATPAALDATLGGWPEVEVGNVQRHGDLLEVDLYGRSDCAEELARRLVEGGLGLRRLQPLDDELERVFLRLTGAQRPTPARQEVS